MSYAALSFSRAGQKPGPFGFSSDTRCQTEPVGICLNHRSPASDGSLEGASNSSAMPFAICPCIHATKQSRSRSEPKWPIHSHWKSITWPSCVSLHYNTEKTQKCPFPSKMGTIWRVWRKARPLSCDPIGLFGDIVSEAPFGAPVSGGKNPVPNSVRASK